MTENFQKANNEDEISLESIFFKLKNWYYFLLTKWKVIFLAVMIGGIIGFIYAFMQKPKYIAETSFVLEDGEKGGGLSQYAGLASMAGIDLGGGAGGIFQGDNIIQLYKSRRMIEETLLTLDTFDNKPQLLIDRYIGFNDLRNNWKDIEKLTNINFSINKQHFSRLQDSVMGIIIGAINKNILEVSKPDKKLSIINVKVKSEDEMFSKSFAENIVSTVNQFYVNTKTKKSAENLFILQKQADSVRNALNNSISGVATAIDANPNSNPAYQTLRVPSQKKQFDVQASGAVYQEVVKNLEIAKITVRKERPLIQVIDSPILPLEKEKLGKLKTMVLVGLLFGFITVIILLSKKWLNKINSK